MTNSRLPLFSPRAAPPFDDPLRNMPWALAEHLRKHFSLDLPDAAVDSNGPTYVVAMTPRSGSSALCHILRSTNAFGTPDEFLNPRLPASQSFLLQHPADDITAYFRSIRRTHSAPSGAFGIKTALYDWWPLIEAELVEPLFPECKYVYLSREDKDLQAVSLFLAEATSYWHSAEPISYQSVEFDKQLILAYRREIEFQEQAWFQHFDERRINPLVISYESFVANPHDAIETIARFLGVELPAGRRFGFHDCPLAKLGGQQNVNWAMALQAERIARANPLPATII